MRNILIIPIFLLLCIGAHTQVLLDVEGDLIRLTSPTDANKFIQLRTDGNDVDIDAGDFLWLNSLGVIITNMDTTTVSMRNVVIHENGTLALRQYKAGDLVHGGIVFWVDETGEHGLVSSLSDLESEPGDFGHQWSVANSVTGATGGTVADGIGDGINAGAMNTMLIVSADRLDTDSAARLCTDLVEGGYGDWYLPSKGELYLMYTNLHLAGLGGFSSSGFWSSTEGNSLTAWGQYFLNGFQGGYDKDDDGVVRCVRAF